MDWFRLYNEFASDPKIQSMPERMQRRWVMVLCLRSAEALSSLADDDVAFALRISPKDLRETKALFISKGFVDDDWNVTHWDKRQFRSDSSAERTAKWREKRRHSDEDVTSQQRHSDGGVTGCDARARGRAGADQSRTETEQIQATPVMEATPTSGAPLPPTAAEIIREVAGQVLRETPAARKTRERAEAEAEIEARRHRNGRP